MLQTIGQRRHDIDWLRTLAFFSLIIYHTGMYYVADWGWHVKSSEQSVWLQNFMLLTNPWRMSLIFFISAIAMSLVMNQSKYNTVGMARLRTKRLLLPLVFSMLVVVPPQLFYELKQFYGFTHGYFDFMKEYLNINTDLAPQKQSPIGLLTWNHLWFLPYLWCYSIILLVIHPLLVPLSNWMSECKIQAWRVLLILLLGSTVIWFFLNKHFPTTHALVDDWFNHAKYFWVFVAGFILPRVPHLWQRLIDCRGPMLILALLGYVWLLMDRHGWLDVGEALEQMQWIQFAHGFLVSINHWAWILAAVGYAGRYLQFSNGFIRYTNKALLPWYILHQTLIIVFAVNLARWQIPAGIEAILLIFLTALVCLFIYEVIRRFNILKPLFGI